MKAISIVRTLLLLLPALTASAAAPAEQELEPTQKIETVLHLLDYVSVEYPRFVQQQRVVNQAEYAEQREFAQEIEHTLRTMGAERFVGSAAELSELVSAKADGAKVVAVAKDLQRRLITAYQIQVAPRAIPDLSAAPALYASNCADCHGARGDGAGSQAASLDPRPTDFRDRSRQEQHSVYALFSTISQGVPGTAMVPFSSLSEDDRWKLALYVSGFMFDDEQRARGGAAWRQGHGRAELKNIEALVTTTPAEARGRTPDGDAILAYLRANPAELAAAASAQSPIALSLDKLERSLDAYRAGRAAEAYDLAVTAYLEGFELVEASLDSQDHDLRTRTEAAMMSYRNALKQARPIAEVEGAYHTAVELLRAADTRLQGPSASPAAGFLSSLIIILREGLEAILVLAAMAAFLVRTGRRDGLPWLHGGWIIALLLGGLTWLVSSRLIAISGAHREVTEGVTALISAGLLLYVGFWLHSKASAVRWNQFIRGRMTSALGGGSLFWVGLVAFLAVYREVFETVLFYQALWMQSESTGQAAILSGLALGGVILAVLGWLLARYSVRLPLGPFFRASSGLLAVMAVVFAGQGIAALQEAGKLAAKPLDFPSIPMLGIYPNLQGIALQLALITVIVAGYFYLRSHHDR